jgi:hypothetical protein
LPGGTITHNFKHTLGCARTEQPLKDYLCQRHSWDAETLDTIDWEAHRRALNRHHKHRTTITKFIHRHLPVGKRCHKYYDKKYPLECCSCNAPEETMEHLFTCPATTRKQWRKDFLKTMRTTMQDMDTRLDLMTLLLEALHKVIHGEDTSEIPVPPELQGLADAQQAIGWDQLLKGRLSWKWNQIQQHHLGTAATKKDNGLTWATTIIDVIYKQFWILWELRNTDRHGRDAITKAQAEHRQAIRELTQLYDLKHRTAPHHQWILEPDLVTRLSWNSSYMRAWINTFRPILEGGYTDALATG